MTDPLHFLVEEWHGAYPGKPGELLAQCSNGLVARAAYAAACELRPKAWIRVSDRARVIAEQNAPKDERG